MQPDVADTVHEGRDGYLFLSGGQHSVFSYFTGARAPQADSPAVFWANLAGRAAWCAEAGIVWRHVIFPEKCVVLRDLLAPGMEISSLFLRHYAPLAPEGPPVLYPLQALTQDAGSCSRTDTHYSTRGNILITAAILQDLFPEAQAGFLPRSLALLKPREIDGGDLGRKLTPPRREVVDCLPKQIVPFKMGSNGISGGNDGIMVLIESRSALSDKTLLIFGDSFFRAILPMLAVFYRRIVFCRSRFFHSEIVRAIRPDHIFTGQAERYLTRCAADSDRPHFLSYPYIKGHTMTPDETFCTLWPRLMATEALLTG